VRVTSSRWIVLLLAVSLMVCLAGSAVWAAPVPSQGSSVSQTEGQAVAAERELVKGRLMDFGLTDEQATSRADLLTEEEIHVLAGDLDSVQAAGAGYGSNRTWMYVGAAVVLWLIFR
jgi:hypothetical protein